MMGWDDDELNDPLLFGYYCFEFCMKIISQPMHIF